MKNFTMKQALAVACALLMGGTMAQAAVTDIYNAADLKAFRDDVNNGNTYSGTTVTLHTNIDLGGESWTPIANATTFGIATECKPNKKFEGTFDGNEYCISNFIVNITAGKGSWNKRERACAGLFGANCGTIQNLSVTNATITGTGYDAVSSYVYTGGIAGLNQGTITNCSVTNCTIKAISSYSLSGNYIRSGGIAGAQDGGEITDCFVSGNNVSCQGGDSKTNDVSNGWNASASSSETGNITPSSSNEDKANYINNKNDAARKANIDGNGINYEWNENGITQIAYFPLSIDNNVAGKYADATIVTTPAVQNYEYNGTHNLYPMGSEVKITFYTNGYKKDFSEAPYYLATVNGATVVIESDSYDFVEEGDYFRYTATASIAMPAAPTTATYTTTQEKPAHIILNYPVLNIDASGAMDGSVRQDAVLNGVVTRAGAVESYEYNGVTYDLYAPGTEMSMTVYLEGYSGNWIDKGYFVETVNGSTDFTAVDREAGEYNATTDRFARITDVTFPMPESTTVTYTTTMVIPTGIEGVEKAATRVYATNGNVVVEAVEGTNIVVADLMGRTLYNNVAKSNRTTIALERGLYIVNGVKVAVR